jgi:hypothetical protein
MDLFKAVNNEALDEDKKAQREVIERERRQVAMFDSPVLATKQLSTGTEKTLSNMIFDFQNAVEKAVAEHYKREFDVSSSGDVPYKYNLIASELKSIKFNELSIADKNKILTALEQVKPKVIQLQGLAEQSKYSDLDIIRQIVNNFQNKKFLPVGISEVKELPSTKEYDTYLNNLGALITQAKSEKENFIGDKRAGQYKLLDKLIKSGERIYEKARGSKKTSRYLKIMKEFYKENNLADPLEIDFPPPPEEELLPPPPEAEPPAEEEVQDLEGDGKQKRNKNKGYKKRK